jgi:Tfp pilus assembly protein PilP
MQENFSYYPAGMPDPFVSFIAPAATAPQSLSDSEVPDEAEAPVEPEIQKPLTPLQRMSLGEIEGGLKAITWGGMGRRALIEDSAGKGYIVSVGTPAGDKNGVVAQIFNDHLVIQQETWDKKLKRMVPQNSVVKLSKESK